MLSEWNKEEREKEKEKEMNLKKVRVGGFDLTVNSIKILVNPSNWSTSKLMQFFFFISLSTFAFSCELMILLKIFLCESKLFFIFFSVVHLFVIKHVFSFILLDDVFINSSFFTLLFLYHEKEMRFFFKFFNGKFLHSKDVFITPDIF